MPFGDYGAYIKYLEAAARVPHVCTCSRCESLHLLSPTSEIGDPRDGGDLQQQEARQKPAGGVPTPYEELLDKLGEIIHDTWDESDADKYTGTGTYSVIAARRVLETLRTLELLRSLDSAVPNPEEPSVTTPGEKPYIVDVQKVNES
jgi:hypothetical protein